MPSYSYSCLPPGKHNTRLLRLLPDEDEFAPIKCTLFNYTLTDTTRGYHLYEALSYAWGGADKHRSITIDGSEHAVTTNLYAAMRRLRDPHLERILWIDALCIDQSNLDERGHQVQLMARVYGMASRVIVWLGESEYGSDQALEAIWTAASKSSTVSLKGTSTRHEINQLLSRPWFSRIWVLQEIAAARQILIACGPDEVEGDFFCRGLRHLDLEYDLHSTVGSAVYLMKGANSRSRIKLHSSGRDTLDICSLGELIDMYHTRNATEHHDKIFALLGMSSDDPIGAGLIPDYSIPWDQLFQQLIKFLLHRNVSVRTWPGTQAAVIQGKGYVVGKVSSVAYSARDSILPFSAVYSAGDSGQRITLAVRRPDGSLEYGRWDARVSVKPVRVDDLICFVNGATNPTIIRPHKDYFSVILISLPIKIKQHESSPVGDLVLFWSWSGGLGYRPTLELEQYTTLMETLTPGYTETDKSAKATRLWNMAMVLQTVEEGKAETRLQGALAAYTRALGESHPNVLRCIHELLAISKRNGRFMDATALLERVVQIKMRVQGPTPDTLENISELASMYREHGILGQEHRWGNEVLEVLLESQADEVQVTENVTSNEDMLELLFD